MYPAAAAVVAGLLAPEHDGAKNLETWEPTNELRWFIPDIWSKPILEQNWVCRETRATQWRAVPVVKGEV